MIIKFVVVWVTTIRTQASCPDYVPSVYTGQYPMGHCSVAHQETKHEVKAQFFEKKEAAQMFIDNAPAALKKSMVILPIE